jgi:GAF domain-containing protein
MAAAFDSAGLPTAKAARYAALAPQIVAVLENEPDRGARMATVAAMLAATFETFLWTGFYMIDPARPGELVVGPYQGVLACLRITFGRGVCGQAASRRETVIVADVDDFPGHITCDGRSRSEIVTPVFDPAGRLIAVLDVDSASLAAFDEVDKEGLTTILHATFAAHPLDRGA